jgi:hypothetical protein
MEEKEEWSNWSIRVRKKEEKQGIVIDGNGRMR